MLECCTPRYYAWRFRDVGLAWEWLFSGCFNSVGGNCLGMSTRFQNHGFVGQSEVISIILCIILTFSSKTNCTRSIMVTMVIY